MFFFLSANRKNNGLSPTEASCQKAARLLRRKKQKTREKDKQTGQKKKKTHPKGQLMKRDQSRRPVDEIPKFTWRERKEIYCRIYFSMAASLESGEVE